MLQEPLAVAWIFFHDLLEVLSAVVVLAGGAPQVAWDGLPGARIRLLSESLQCIRFPLWWCQLLLGLLLLRPRVRGVGRSCCFGSSCVRLWPWWVERLWWVHCFRPWCWLWLWWCWKQVPAQWGLLLPRVGCLPLELGSLCVESRFDCQLHDRCQLLRVHLHQAMVSGSNLSFLSLKRERALIPLLWSEL